MPSKLDAASQKRQWPADGKVTEELLDEAFLICGEASCWHRAAQFRVPWVPRMDPTDMWRAVWSPTAEESVDRAQPSEIAVTAAERDQLPVKGVMAAPHLLHVWVVGKAAVAGEDRSCLVRCV
jgi:hypothetical protein